ncbi:hypothetical protein [Brevundimonas sp.]|uniref:hypothetical protein n=1 Tax=Brevundimonas sp. TaxID=1871086 RepID=UPI002737CC21|nr:hypothetical protein [Brevundimonas sp.]MDP3800611.1 hypothetical protein [Brevundimonas sp.]
MDNTSSLHPQASRTADPASEGGVDGYRALDLTQGSSLCVSLMDSVEHEQAEGGRIDLTDELGSHPCGFTPQMMSWYQSEIAPARSAALAEVRSGFEGAALNRTAAGRGKLIPAERTRNDQAKLIGYNLVHTDFRRDHQQKIDERETRRAEFEEARAMRGNRDPVLTRFWYYLGLVAVVVLEAGVNVESLMQLPWITSGLFATTAAILVGLSVGGASHLHGTVLKQWHYWFNSHESTRVWKASRKIAIGTVLLGAGLALIAWARFYYIQPQIEIAIIRGTTPPNLITSIMFMTVTNVIVYGVGAMLAYFCHDEDPDYPPKKVELDKAEKALDGLRRSINLKLKEIDDRWHAELRKLEVFETSQSSSPAWEANRQALARLTAVDDRVEAALNRYKNALVSRLRSQGQAPIFVQPTVTRDDAGREERLSAEQYLARPAKLRML